MNGFKSLRTVNLMSKTKNVAEGRKYEDAELEALLAEDSCQTQKELALTLGVTQQTISYRLKSLEMIQKQGNWVPYELKPRNIEFSPIFHADFSHVKCCLPGINERVFCII